MTYYRSGAQQGDYPAECEVCGAPATTTVDSRTPGGSMPVCSIHAPWTVDLPNWQGQPDPEVQGSTVWVHTDYDGKPDMALALLEEGRPEVSVLQNPLIAPNEIDGEHLGTFTSWDSALDFALSALEVLP